uniref:Si:ch211-196f5.2 n=1 Tax=Gouania willdenowi TaxID=441366 RepID=A0A8C5N6I5_GOUWI
IINRGTHRGKLAADEEKKVQEEAPGGKLIRVELEWDVPMEVKLPLEVKPDPAHQPFPFLDTTLSDLGIEESDVKERVVWVDNTKKQVKNRVGKLKEKEITILEVRVKAQRPGDKQLQEVLYSTEAHTDRSFCRTGVDIQPWKQTHTGEDKLTPPPRSFSETQELQEICRATNTS